MAEEKYVPRLKQQYIETVRDELQKKFEYKNVNQIPKFEKIVVNMGVGEAAQDSKAIDGAVADLRTITGQQPIVTHARKSIATFKLRQGMAIGAKVTLRNVKMYEFLERLIRVALPRIRDFNGIAEKMDGQGNYTLGIKEQIIFPEIDIDKNPRIHGLEITFVTTARTDEECHALLKEFGLPFKKHNN